MNAKSIALFKYCPNLVILHQDYEKQETLAMREGDELHQQLGFTNTRKYIAIIPYMDLVIAGVPDKVDGDTVYELKTVSSPFIARIYQKAYIEQLKIYMYLTQRKRGVLLIYDRDKDQYIKEIEITKLDKKQLLRDIYYAVKYYRQGKIDRGFKGKKCRYCILKTYCIATEYTTMEKFI